MYALEQESNQKYISIIIDSKICKIIITHLRLYAFYQYLVNILLIF